MALMVQIPYFQLLHQQAVVQELKMLLVSLVVQAVAVVVVVALVQADLVVLEIHHQHPQAKEIMVALMWLVVS
jgi:hypothetical protein